MDGTVSTTAEGTGEVQFDDTTLKQAETLAILNPVLLEGRV